MGESPPKYKRLCYNKIMKRFVGVFLVAVGLLNCFAVPTDAMGVNDFRITSYDVQMKLGRNSENRSTLETKETITAQFPEYDQNHGIERVFVSAYDGHPTKLSIRSVANEAGQPLHYSMSNGVMRIGDANTYVHGRQTYVISYVQQDVTRFFSDTNKDEFYWDVIGVDWQVPIDQVSVQLTVDKDVISSLTGDATCYSGVSGSTTTCQIDETNTGYIVTVSSLLPHEGVTVAFGFTPGTFAMYTPSLFDKILQVWIMLQIIGLLLSLIIVSIVVVRQRNRMNRKKELIGIPVEYLPPNDSSVTASAKIMQYPQSIQTAQLLDLAVRHYIRIYETSEKTLFSPADYTIEIAKDVNQLRWEEREILTDSFGSVPAVGERLQLSSLRNNTAYYFRTIDNDSGITKRIRGEYGLRALDETEQRRLRRSAGFVFLGGLLLVSPVWWLVAATQFGLSFTCWRLTDKGLDLRRYLEGLREYIKMAEVDRIKMLQSPEGAEKVSRIIHGTDEAQLITLYERTLPYAVLFGLEKDWNKQLGHYYEVTNTQPTWYVGHSGVFNAAVFTSAMSSFGTVSNYSSSSSSTSGGSGGGGFSGGGGGGGGGGGW